MSKTPLAKADLSWFRMDDPTNRMIITGTMTLGAPINFVQLKTIIQTKLLRYRKFRQRIVVTGRLRKRYYWQDDPNFNIDDHLVPIELPEPKNQTVLQNFISETLAYGLEYSRPLWRIYFVEEYNGGSAVIFRFHHVIADGISLMHVLLSAADNSPEPSAVLTKYSPAPPVKSSIIEHSMQDLAGAVNSSKKTFEKIGAIGSRVKENPELIGEYIKLGLDTTLAAGRLIVRPPDPDSQFTGSLGLTKQAAWSNGIPLDDIKSLANVYGATVNDVLVSLVAGALRGYILERYDSIDYDNFSSFIPVNLRPIELNENLGNEFGLVVLTLPINEEHAVDRLYKSKYQMDSLKSSHEAIATYGIINLLGMVPAKLQYIGAKFLDTKGTIVITNVPGPQEQLYLAGAPVDSIMAWVPQSSSIGLGISLISYNNCVWIGVASDERLVPDPELVVNFFEQELETLKELASQHLEKRHAPYEPLFRELQQTLDALDEALDHQSLEPPPD